MDTKEIVPIPQAEAVLAVAAKGNVRTVAVVGIDESDVSEKAFFWAMDTLAVDSFILLHIQRNDQLNEFATLSDEEIQSQVADAESVFLRKKYMELAKQKRVIRLTFTLYGEW